MHHTIHLPWYTIHYTHTVHTEKCKITKFQGTQHCIYYFHKLMYSRPQVDNHIILHMLYFLLQHFVDCSNSILVLKWQILSLCFVGVSTCILCGCIRTTVYCDDHNLDAVPPLPKDTTHVYLRFNKISKINKNDFSYLSMYHF